jgi:hypothetical protein
MTPFSTQNLTEMSTRDLSVGKGRQECKADNLTAICESFCTVFPQSLCFSLLISLCPILVSRGTVRLGPFGTFAHLWRTALVVPAPDDDG